MLTGAWGWVLVSRGDLDGAEAVMAESVRLAEQVGDGLQTGLLPGVARRVSCASAATPSAPGPWPSRCWIMPPAGTTPRSRR